METVHLAYSSVRERCDIEAEKGGRKMGQLAQVETEGL